MKKDLRKHYGVNKVILIGTCSADPKTRYGVNKVTLTTHKANTMTIKIDRIKTVCADSGMKRSTLYARQAEGLFSKSISLGGRCVGWIRSEVEAINRARIAGLSDEQIRALVIELKAKRGVAND